MHSTLFAATLTALDLETRYGAYQDRLAGTTLATVNLVSLFGLHRRRRGATIGHLAVIEMTSAEPMGRYSRALARIGIGAEGRRFFDVHVAADTRHGGHRTRPDGRGCDGDRTVSARRPALRGAAILMVEERFARHLLGAWSAHRSSLLPTRTGQTGQTATQRRGPYGRVRAGPA